MTVETPAMPVLGAPTALSSTSASTSARTASGVAPAARLTPRLRPRVRSRSPRTSLDVSKLASLACVGSDVARIDDLAAIIARLHELADGNGFFGPVEGAKLGNGPGKTVILVARSTRQGRQEAGREEDESQPAEGREPGLGEVVGAAQISFNAKPNAHRADVRVVVARDPDGEVARRLMAAVEEEAKAGKAKLLLLTTIAHSPAQTLYESLGWTLSGVIPLFAAYERQMRDAALLYKDLRCGNCDECECEPETKLQW